MSDTPFHIPTLETIAEALPAFEFEAFIAQGGMGVVYKATQRSLDRSVAIKILPRELGEDPAFRGSFETEARAMARLNHPNLIAIYDFGEADGLLYLVMEFVNGKSLHHSAHGQRIDPGQAVELAIGICRGLGHAHEGGIIHRDVKPANILLTPRAEPKVGDFGLARPAGPAAGGLAMGTPGYAAPEVLSDPEHADQRSDLFAVGVILREMLTGQPVGSSEAPEPIQDPALEALAQRATAPDPNDRFQGAEELISELAAWQSQALGANHHPPADSGRPTGSTTAPIAPTRDTTGYASSQGVKLAVIVALLAVIAVVWKTTEKVEAARAAEAREVAAAAAPPPRSQPSKPAPVVDPALVPAAPTVAVPSAPELEPEPESPARSLARLQPDLAAGRRDEMPLGTLDHGASQYFFVPAGMTLPEARRFAAGHGGNLALPAAAADLEWLAARLGERQEPGEAWLGAGRSELQGWQLDDGSPWDLPSPTGDDAAVVLTPAGTLETRDPETTAGFFIEWRRDGSQPTTLAVLLEKTAASLGGDAPVFPPGTFALGERRVLVVTKEAAFAEARRLAESAGGSLLTLPVATETEELARRLADQNSAGPWWLGATRDMADEWRWIDGSPWYHARWALPEEPIAGGAAVISADGSWAGMDPETQTAGFLIAWGEAPTPPAPADADQPTSLADLRATAAGLFADLQAKRMSALAENAEEFTWKLDVWLRRNTRSEVERLTPHVRRLKESVVEHRIPPPTVVRGTVVTPDMAAIREQALEKQKRIDAEFLSGAARIRDAYVPRLEQRLAVELERGQPDLAERIRTEQATSADLIAWVDTFGVGLDPEPKLEIAKAVYGARGNDADVTQVVKDLIEVRREPFRVLVPDLGVDPDPGWNKNLTVKFQIDGRDFDMFFARNDQVSREILLGAGMREEPDPHELTVAAAGTWVWDTGNTFELTAEGETIDHLGARGTLEVIDAERRVLSGEFGKTSYTLELDPSARQLSVINEATGDRYQATRRE